MWILIVGNLLNIIGYYLVYLWQAATIEMGLFGAGISIECCPIIMLIIFAGLFFLAVDTKKYHGFTKGHFNKNRFLTSELIQGWPPAKSDGN